jgi:hypothetical protein
MLFIAAALVARAPCVPTAIAAAAAVSQPRLQDFSAIGLSRLAAGFQRPVVQEVIWTGPCTPRIVGLYGGRTFVTAGGLLLWPMETKVEVRYDPIPQADPEPPHPTWNGRRFVGSAALMAGTWRVGAWVRPDGTTDLARFRADDGAAPIPMLTSARPLVGIFYLGAPDSVGGTLSFAQRLGHARFRVVSMAWSEAGLRSRSP